MRTCLVALALFLILPTASAAQENNNHWIESQLDLYRLITLVHMDVAQQAQSVAGVARFLRSVAANSPMSNRNRSELHRIVGMALSEAVKDSRTACNVLTDAYPPIVYAMSNIPNTDDLDPKAEAVLGLMADRASLACEVAESVKTSHDEHVSFFK